ncbi:MAG: CheR family methyltransferase [Thermodesulfobacteriota bacterium]
MARQTRAQPPPDLPLAAVARTPGEVADLVRRLAEVGQTAVPLDVEEALDGKASVAVVDPQGWEDSCRRALSTYELRQACPPAVLLTGSDPLALHRIEPTHGFLDLSLEHREVAATVSRARRARERFAACWPEPLSDLPRQERARIAALLEAGTGLEIRSDREGAFLQAVRTRMVGGLFPTAREYTGAVARNGAEVAALAALLSVGETYFWRYSGQFLALQALLVPSLPLAPRGAPSPLRIWSAGCATGEEAYSLAIACLEAVGPGGEVEVVGTDLNPAFLAQARAGIYRERSLRNLPVHLRRKYLELHPGGARVAQALGRRVRFDRLNLGGGELAPWAAANGPFHAIFCRNTLIYLSRGAAERIVGVFEGALSPGGGLFLGASESLLSRCPALEVSRGMGSFFYRKAAAVPAAASPPPAAASSGGAAGELAAELYGAGLAALDGEEVEGARRAFQELVGRCPGDARGHGGLAILLANEGREAEAEAHLQEAARRRPILPEVPYLRGLLAERRGDELAALRHYREALATAPDFFMAHLNRAWILRRLGRHESFAEELRCALAILKTRPRVASWLTGGMGREGLLSLVAESLAGAAGA